jgi:hypothetical protein
LARDGLVTTSAEALSLIQDQWLGCAVIDPNLAYGTIFPVADAPYDA